ncbi:hypothetical protein C0Q70_21329 [Pomacea canaliculata]|uniref:Uncharacterized protein n=1 Tax=Pomacea canaliculata TaxID=400727 RepID=A0A2T7NC91_POMCA|nr:hypothetical protein C0Q70_21329 [Pomacea canaliculata]
MRPLFPVSHLYPRSTLDRPAIIEGAACRLQQRRVEFLNFLPRAFVPLRGKCYGCHAWRPSSTPVMATECGETRSRRDEGCGQSNGVDVARDWRRPRPPPVLLLTITVSTFVEMEKMLRVQKESARLRA